MARDEDLDLLKAIRVLAFDAVKNKDSDYLLRHIFRWYSREFHTPLPEVEEMPLEEVLTHFFECRYEGMEDEDLEAEEKRLAETREERLQREEKEKLDDEDADAFFRDVKAESKTQLAKLGTKRKLDEAMDDPDLDRPVLLPIMGEKLPQTFQQVVEKMEPTLKSVPPEIKMEFMSDAELGDLDDWDILGPPRPRTDDA